MHEAAMVRQMAGRAPEADRRNPEEVLGRGEEVDSVTVSNAPVGTSSAPANARMCFPFARYPPDSRFDSGVTSGNVAAQLLELSSMWALHQIPYCTVRD